MKKLAREFLAFIKKNPHVIKDDTHMVELMRFYLIQAYYLGREDTRRIDRRIEMGEIL